MLAPFFIWSVSLLSRQRLRQNSLKDEEEHNR